MTSRGEPRLDMRLAQYARWQANCQYLGGGIGGLVLLGGLLKDSFTGAPYTLRAIFVTAVVVAAATVGRAYIGYLAATFRLKAAQVKEGLTDDAILFKSATLKYPLTAFIAFWIGLIAVIFATCILIIAAWTPPVPATQPTIVYHCQTESSPDVVLCRL